MSTPEARAAAKAAEENRLREIVFNALDSDHAADGRLSMYELKEMMVAWGVPKLEAEDCFRTIIKDNMSNWSPEKGIPSLSKHDFYVDCEPIWKFQIAMMKHAIQKVQPRYHTNTVNIADTARTLALSRSRMSICMYVCVGEGGV